MFHTGIQYCPVDSMATSVTRQARSQARNRLKFRVKVRNSCFLIWTSVLPTGGKTVTVNLSRCTSIPQQRRYPGSIQPPPPPVAKDARECETTILLVLIAWRRRTTIPGPDRKRHPDHSAIRATQHQLVTGLCFAGGVISRIALLIRIFIHPGADPAGAASLSTIEMKTKSAPFSSTCRQTHPPSP